MHCDLKLDNILLNYDENSMKITEICVSDFGLCSTRKNLKSGTDCRGSVPYMAPEIFLEGQRYDKRVDCWSLGIILHLLLTLEFPFNGETSEEIIDKIKTFDIDFVENDSLENVSIEACDLIENLLQKDPKSRLSSSEINKQSWLLSSSVDVKI